MLKITLHENNSHPVLKLEGKLCGPWVDEFREACGRAGARGGTVRLDLRQVSFVDPAGTIALRELLREGVVLAACSPFVAELLKESLS
jgi:anti-anti-sigma regulatory factor